MDSTPLPGIIPDSSSSAMAMATTTGATDDRPRPAKRVYGAGIIKRAFANTDPTPSSDEGAVAATVVPETVRTARDREESSTSGVSSPSPVMDQGGFYQGRAALQAQLDAIDTAPSPTTSPHRPVGADALARSASSSQGSGADTTLKTTDTNPTSEPDDESPPVQRREVKKPSRKGARIASSSSDEDELPTAGEILDDEAEKRRRRKVELERRAAEKHAQAEQDAARRAASEDAEDERVGKRQQQEKKKKAKTVESDQDEEMAALEKPVKAKGKAKGLTKKEHEEMSRSMARYEREQAFNGIVANTLAPVQPLSAVLHKIKTRNPPPATAVASSSTITTKLPTGSSPIEDGFSSQSGTAKVIELGTSSQSAATAPRTTSPPRLETRSAPAKPRPSSDDDEELPDVGATLDEAKRRAAEDAQLRSKAAALQAQKLRAAAQRVPEASPDSDSDLDVVDAPVLPHASSRKTPRRTDTFDHLHRTAASKTVSRFAPEGHRKPRRHDSKGFLTESNLPTNTQIRTAGKTVHLRGQEGLATPARRHPLANGAEAGPAKKGKAREEGEKKAALLDGKSLDQTLLARHRTQAAVVRSKKEADFVAHGGQLFAERERLKKQKKEDEEAKLKTVLEGAKERMANNGQDEEDEEDDANDGDWEEERQEEGDEEEEGEEWGSASEREASGDEEEEEDEDPPSSSDEEGEAPDENADPRSMSDASVMMVPTEPASPESAPAVPTATSRQPFSQLPGYVSPPASQAGSPMLPLDDHFVGLPGFGAPVRASTPSDDGAGLAFSQTQRAPVSPMEDGSRPGFTQFFGASFTQDVGRRVGQQGFERASLAELDKEPSQCLLPAVEVLPEEYERDAIKLGAAAMFRDATPVDDRPELYLNDEGMLTQSKPGPRAPMAATPMSQFSMHTPFALRRNATRSTVVDDEESQGAPRALIRRRPGMDDESQDLLTGDGHRPRVRRVIAADGDEEDEAEPEEEQEQCQTEQAPVERDAFSALMANRKRSSSPGAEPDKKAKKKKHRSDFVADAASESEDEYGMGVGADRHESDADSDEEDSHQQVEGLVEDAPVDAELQAAQDELAAEKAKADEAERDARLQKKMEDVAQGKVRRKRKEGDQWSSDSEDDDEYARKAVNKHANKKRVRTTGQDLEALADNERTAAFYTAYKDGTLTNDEPEAMAFLQTHDEEMKAASGSEDDDDRDSYGEDKSEYEDDDDVELEVAKAPAMDIVDEAPEYDGTRDFLAGGSSSPKQAMSFRNHLSLRHVGAPERAAPARSGPVNNFGAIAHDDLRYVYDSQNDWSEAVRSNVAEAFKDDTQTAGDPSRRAGKSSAVTAFIRPKVGSSRAGGSDAAFKAAKSLGKAHAGGSAAQKRDELMRPTKTMTSIRQKARPAK